MRLENMPTDAQATKFGVEPVSPDFVFGSNYDSVFHMMSNSEHLVPAEEACAPVWNIFRPTPILVRISKLSVLDGHFVQSVTDCKGLHGAI